MKFIKNLIIYKINYHTKSVIIALKRKKMPDIFIVIQTHYMDAM